MRRLSARQVEGFLQACTAVVGAEHVIGPAEAQIGYADAMAPRDPASYAPAGAVAPAATEEVQAIVRLAGEHAVPRRCRASKPRRAV